MELQEDYRLHDYETTKDLIKRFTERDYGVAENIFKFLQRNQHDDSKVLYIPIGAAHENVELIVKLLCDKYQVNGEIKSFKVFDSKEMAVEVEESVEEYFQKYSVEYLDSLKEVGGIELKRTIARKQPFYLQGQYSEVLNSISEDLELKKNNKNIFHDAPKASITEISGAKKIIAPIATIVSFALLITAMSTGLSALAVVSGVATGLCMMSWVVVANQKTEKQNSYMNSGGIAKEKDLNMQNNWQSYLKSGREQTCQFSVGL